MNAQNIIISWWEIGKETQSWVRIDPEKISEAIETIKELIKWGYLKKDNYGNVMTISNTKGVIIRKLKEEDLT